LPYEPSTASKATRREAPEYSPESATDYIRRLQAANREGSGPVCGCLSDRVAILLWARESEKIVSPSYIEDRIEFGAIEYRDSGNEHTVYHDPTWVRALKITHENFLARVGAVLAYLDRLTASNEVFGDDVRIVGVVRRGLQLQILTSQPWIFEEEGGVAISLVEIDSYFERLKFRQFKEPDGQAAFYDPDTGLVVTDAHSRNFIRSKGELVPIDVKLEPPTLELWCAIKTYPWGRALQRKSYPETGS
jgi:hypothetical protein